MLLPELKEYWMNNHLFKFLSVDFFFLNQLFHNVVAQLF